MEGVPPNISVRMIAPSTGIHVFQGVGELLLYLVDVFVREDVHVLELLLLSHYQFGGGNHLPGKVEMSHYNDSYHRASLSMSLCSTLTL